MSELKPCPFCGCDMEIETVGRSWWRIKPIDGHEDLCPFGEEHEFDCSQQYSKQEHINDWNQRMAESALTEVINLKEEECKQLAQDKGEIMELLKVLANHNCPAEYYSESELDAFFRASELIGAHK